MPQTFPLQQTRRGSHYFLRTLPISPGLDANSVLEPSASYGLAMSAAKYGLYIGASVSMAESQQ